MTQSFNLDTSGVVKVPTERAGIHHHYFWSDLDPFTQSYVKALFASVRILVIECRSCDWDAEIARPLARWSPARCERCGGVTDEVEGSPRSKGFSDLAPETVVRIIADCAAIRAPLKGAPGGITDGAVFWRMRQNGQLLGFPPLTPYLGDDGLVYLREEA